MYYPQVADSRVDDNHDPSMSDNQSLDFSAIRDCGLGPSFDAGARKRHEQEAVDAGTRLLLGLSASHADPDVAVRDHILMRNFLPVPNCYVRAHI